MKYNQKKKKENVEIFLFIMVMAVFAAVLGVMSLGEKMQPVNQIRKISSGWVTVPFMNIRIQPL